MFKLKYKRFTKYIFLIFLNNSNNNFNVNLMSLKSKVYFKIYIIP